MFEAIAIYIYLKYGGLGMNSSHRILTQLTIYKYELTIYAIDKTPNKTSLTHSIDSQDQSRIELNSRYNKI